MKAETEKINCASLPERLLAELRKQAEAPHEYINPHFLFEIVNAIEMYYDLEDDVVDKWIGDMWSA